MNLWIRSQDKTTLQQIIDGLGIVYENSKFKICTKDIASKTFYLGAYKTQKRALEVLDEIQKALEANDDFEYTGRACICNNNLIYEMPKE